MDDNTLQAINTKLKSDFKLIKQFESGIANLNYLLENSSGKKIVARILKEQKLENLQFEHLVQTKLKSAGIGSPQIFLDPANVVLSEAKRSVAQPKDPEEFLKDFLTLQNRIKDGFKA